MADLPGLEDRDRYLETVVLSSWSEHVRQHGRASRADGHLEDLLRKCTASSTPMFWRQPEPHSSNEDVQLLIVGLHSNRPYQNRIKTQREGSIWRPERARADSPSCCKHTIVGRMKGAKRGHLSASGAKGQRFESSRAYHKTFYVSVEYGLSVTQGAVEVTACRVSEGITWIFNYG